VQLEHHILGASGIKTWGNCTWSPQMQARYPDEESEYAAEGTAAHIVTERARHERRPADHYLGEIITFPRKDGDGVWEFECDQEMVDAVAEFLSYVDSLPSDAVFIEETLSYGRWVDSDNYGPGFGTVDDARVDIEAEVAYITDFKYGKGVPVSVTDNWQLWMYALAFYHTYGHLYDVTEFQMAIVQPRNGGTSFCTIQLDFLLDWAESFVRPQSIQAADENEGVFAPSEDACRFCRARHRCRARAAWVFNAVDPDFPTLSNNELAIILPHMSEMKRALETWEATALHEVEQGNAVGDYKRVAGKRGNRAWVNEDAVIKALTSRSKATGGGLKKANIYKPGKLISPTEAEKILGKDHPIITFTERDGDIVRKIDSEFIGRTDGKPVLVPGDDPRADLDVDAASEFENLDELEPAGPDVGDGDNQV